MLGIFVADSSNLEAMLSHMDKVAQEWTKRAARGECAWICADCCVTFPEGMPNACEHGHQRCTDIITRDKKRANA